MPRIISSRRLGPAFIAMMALVFGPGGGPAAARRAEPPVRIAQIGHFVVGGERISLRGLPPRARFHAPCPEPAPVEPVGDFVPEERPPLRPGQAAGRPVSPPCALPPEVDPNGDFTPGATYVQFIRLASPRRPFPLLLLPGGGLDGSIYETTPDGRPGWESVFLRSGYSLFIADLQQTGRSPWARYPEINPLEPAFRNHTFLWEVFRIGPPGSYDRGRQAFAGTQFPVAAFDDFARLAAPYFRVPAEIQAQNYDAIIRRACPCILVAHSASAGPAIAAGYRNAGLVKAIVAVEPATVPAPPNRPAPPVLILWGDYLSPHQTQADWETEHEASCGFARASSRNAPVTLIDLPGIGIRGNSHLLMADRNSDRIARLIDRWLGAVVGPGPLRPFGGSRPMQDCRLAS